MAPIFFDYKRTPLSLKKTCIALDVFNTYLQQLGTKYAATGKHSFVAGVLVFNIFVSSYLYIFKNLFFSKTNINHNI